MGIKVCKFGGTSVADGIQLKKIKNIIQNDKSRRYVIVSAPGKRFSTDNKITDLLYLCQKSVEHNIPYEQLFQVIIDRFEAIKNSIDSKVDLTDTFNYIRKKLDTGCSADYIASRGEHINALIMADFLGYDFVDTKGLIIFEDGKLLLEETDKALKKELAKHERAVLPGFYGSTAENGKIQTFTRGGSDITGALVARAMGAEVYENWTDVSGFLMADPSIVENPKPIDNVTYKELRELAYMGASVLHEDAIFPAKAAGIPINIRNTNDVNDKGTLITAEPLHDNNRIITGIAGSKDFAVIAIYKNMMSSEKGFIRRIFAILDDMDIAFEHLPRGIDAVSVVVSREGLEGKEKDLLDSFEKQLEPDSMEYYNDIALISTVGTGMGSKPGVAAKLLKALADSNINIRMIDQGSSEINITVAVQDDDFENAIRAIYKSFDEEVK